MLESKGSMQTQESWMQVLVGRMAWKTSAGAGKGLGGVQSTSY